jgi:hypothetical protein
LDNHFIVGKLLKKGKSEESEASVETESKRISSFKKYKLMEDLSSITSRGGFEY